nr:hypothetical protein [uncultured Sphingomonas sp.]
MNRFFDREEWRRGFPKRAFARLDDLEPIAAGPDDDRTFLLDAVDADWKGFGPGGMFDLGAPDLKQRIAARWRGGFGGEPTDGPDGYEEVPVYRIEVSLSRGHPLFQTLPRTEEPWITLHLTDQETETPVDVYGGLFAAPTRAFLHAAPAPAPAGPLNAIFDMTTWPDTSEADLLHALRAQCEVEALVCFDIGQGSASALLCQCGVPIYYFDTGCGSGRNAPTAPARIDFCTCWGPTVILSHWDTDHWAGASRHAGLQGRTWIVPRQTISTTHTAFANAILRAGGRILVVGHGAPPLQWTSMNQDYDLRRGTGSGRNGTGLVLIVTDRPSGRSWVLTGDAGYDDIPHAAPADIAAMVVPHHGADMGSKSTPFPRSSSAYARLFYSFGPGNGHGPKKPPVQHPVSAATAAHAAQGWQHGSWPAASPAAALAGGDVLATATHSSSHLGGAVAGWTGPPALTHLPACPNAMPVSQR